MKLGLQTGSNNIHKIVDECRNTEVNHIVLSVTSVPKLVGYETISPEAIKECENALKNYNIQLSGLISPNPSREAVIGENQDELGSIYKILKDICKSGIKLVLFYPLDQFKNYKDEYHHTKPPLEIMPGEEKWDKIISFFQRVSDIAEDGDLRIANHIFAIDIMDEILNTVKSPNLGVTYCTGMYIFGYDPYTVIKKFGVEKIFLCHARNLIRHGPGRQGHEEVPLERGDIDIEKYIRILAEAGYDGLIIPEHWGDNGDLLSSMTYLKKSLQKLSNELSIDF